MNYIKISLGIFLALAASRFIPHPPNFTSLIALSFYIPAILGIRFIPALIASFFITDLIIGFHGLALFTWGSVIFVGLMSKFFLLNITSRIIGSLFGACIFFVITNFGVWTTGVLYEYSLKGLTECYILALPFFGNTLVSTILFSTLIEIVVNSKKFYKNLQNKA